MPLLSGMASGIGGGGSGNFNKLTSGGNKKNNPIMGADAMEGRNASGSAAIVPLGIILHGKDGGRWIEFSTCSESDAQRAHEALNTYAFPGRRNLGYLFAFESRRAEVMKTASTDTAVAGNCNLHTNGGQGVGQQGNGAAILTNAGQFSKH